MKKRYIVIPASMALLLGLCAANSAMPEGFEKNQVLTLSKNFITKANRRAYENCYSLLSPAMRDSMSCARLESILSPVLDSLGDFVRFKGFSVTAKQTKGQPYVQCIVKCQYENESADFTISISKDLMISGLSIH